MTDGEFKSVLAMPLYKAITTAMAIATAITMTMSLT